MGDKHRDGDIRRLALLDAYRSIDPLELCMEVFLDGHEIPPPRGSSKVCGTGGQIFTWSMTAAAFGRQAAEGSKIYMAGDVRLNETTIDDWYRVDGRRERRKGRLAMGLADDGSVGRLTREDRIDIFLSRSRLTDLVEYMRLKRPEVQRTLDKLRRAMLGLTEKEKELPPEVVNEFNRIDRNGDKQISLEELSAASTAKLYQAIGTAASLPAGASAQATATDDEDARRLGQSIFSRADLDGDASVTESELAAAIEEYRLDKAASPGCYESDGTPTTPTKATLVQTLLRQGLTYARIAKELERRIGSTKLAATGYARLSAESIARLAWPITGRTSKSQAEACRAAIPPTSQINLAGNISYVLSLFLPGPELGLERWRAGQEFTPDRGSGAIYRVVSASLVPGTARHDPTTVEEIARKGKTTELRTRAGVFKASITVDATKKVKGRPEEQICYQKKVAILRNFRRLLGPLAAEATWELDVAPPVERVRSTSMGVRVRPEKTDAERRAEAREVAATEMKRGRREVVQARAAAAEARQDRALLIEKRREEMEGYNDSLYNRDLASLRRSEERRRIQREEERRARRARESDARRRQREEEERRVRESDARGRQPEEEERRRRQREEEARRARESDARRELEARAAAAAAPVERRRTTPASINEDHQQRQRKKENSPAAAVARRIQAERRKEAELAAVGKVSGPNQRSSTGSRATLRQRRSRDRPGLTRRRRGSG